jgi:hypothetical protein
MTRAMNCYYILDADNHAVEVDLLTWGMWFEDADNRAVRYTQITSAVAVSTVFLGINHRVFSKGPPLLFETLIFGGPLDGEGARYSSYDDAETGHATFVRKARAAIGQRVE